MLYKSQILVQEHKKGWHPGLWNQDLSSKAEFIVLITGPVYLHLWGGGGLNDCSLSYRIDAKCLT